MFPPTERRPFHLLRLLLTIVFLLLLAVRFGNLPQPAHLATSGTASNLASLETLARELLPPGLTLAVASDVVVPFTGQAADGKTVWYAVLSQSADPAGRGYAGPVPLLVGVDQRFNVTGLKILPHFETPTFVQGIDAPWFLGQFTGKSLADRLQPFDDIDGITHATVTVKAICSGIQASLRYLAGSAGKSTPAPAIDLQHFWYAAVLFMVLLVVLFELRMSRTLSSILVLILLGFLSQQYLSLAHLPTLLRQFFSPLQLPTSRLIFLSVAVAFALFRPRGYCLSLCPMGRFQDLVHSLGQGLVHHAEPASAEVQGFSGSLGWVLLWGALLLLSVDPSFPVERLEVFAAFFVRNQGLFGWFLVFFAATGSLLLKRFYCHLLCPLHPLFLDFEALKQPPRPTPDAPAESSPRPEQTNAP